MRRVRIVASCGWCGRQIEKTIGSRKRFCSQSCNHKAYREAHPKVEMEDPNWKPGPLIWIFDHFNSTRYLEADRPVSGEVRTEKRRNAVVYVYG